MRHLGRSEGGGSCQHNHECVYEGAVPWCQKYKNTPIFYCLKVEHLYGSESNPI